MELPNLDGQPGWVVIVVVALVVMGGVGVAWLKRKAAADPEDAPQVEAKGDTVALPAGPAPLDLVRDTMGVLATQAAQHKQDADRAEEEARVLARELAACGRDMAVLQERYSALSERYSSLERQLRECRKRSEGHQ